VKENEKVAGKNETVNLIFSGVGGQGVLLATELICGAALQAGMDVKKSEIHGMAQRGGSVVSHVRYGEKVYSPIIEKGTADVVVSFELLEAARYLEYLKPGGMVIVNDLRLAPMPVLTGKAEYPTDLDERLAAKADKVYKLPAQEVANNIGNKNVVNVVILGALSKLLEFDEDHWKGVLDKRVPERFIEVNRIAFKEGRNLVD
jgi:indolepyruvate ferredoxin oxidoreductase beta subunit